MQLQANYDFKWDDWICTHKFAFICEKEMDDVVFGQGDNVSVCCRPILFWDCGGRAEKVENKMNVKLSLY